MNFVSFDVARSRVELAGNNNNRLLGAIRDGRQDTIKDADQQIIQRQSQVASTLNIRQVECARL